MMWLIVSYNGHWYGLNPSFTLNPLFPLSILGVVGRLSFCFPFDFKTNQLLVPFDLNPFPAFRTSYEVCGKVHSVWLVCCLL